MQFLQRKYPPCQFLLPLFLPVQLSLLHVKLPFKQKLDKEKTKKTKKHIFPQDKESIGTFKFQYSWFILRQLIATNIDLQVLFTPFGSVFLATKQKKPVQLKNYPEKYTIRSLRNWQTRKKNENENPTFL